MSVYKIDDLIDLLNDVEYVDCSLWTKQQEDLMDSFYNYLESALADLESIENINHMIANDEQ